MIHDLKPYPAYKDSGVQWLGMVPERWAQLPGRACYCEKRVPNTGMRESTVLSLSYGQIVVKPIEKLHGLVPASFETYQIVEPGDIIIRPTDLQNDWNSLRFGLSRHRGIITSAYMCFRTKETLTREYGHLLLHTYDLKKVFYGLGSGLRQNLDWRDFKHLPCVEPPIPEQSAIVRFLNHADRRIRGFIRAKQKLMKLLEEQKQAIIHRAVTRGLNPNVRLRPSGVEWLGDVPDYWEVVRVKQCATTISKGTTPSTEGRELLDSGPVRFLKAENLVHGGIVDKPLFFIDEATNAVIRRSQLHEGDVLFVIAGATLGKTAVIDQKQLPANTNQAVAFIRPNKRATSHYVALWLQSPRVKELIWLNAVQSAQPNLSMADLGNFVIPLPPLPEQREILLWLQNALVPEGAASDRAQKEITLLREYRTRLIADVVTGKLDVREAAANLPVEPEESELSLASSELDEEADVETSGVDDGAEE